MAKMLKLADYVKQVLNEEDDATEINNDDDTQTEPKEPKEKECDTVLSVECCGTALKKIVDAIKKTDGNFKVEIDTGDEEKETSIDWNSETDMIGSVKSEKNEAE